MIKTWLYVICERNEDGEAQFRAEFLLAENEQSAYDVGAKVLQQPTDGRGINDCVFEVGSAPDGAAVFTEHGDEWVVHHVPGAL